MMHLSADLQAADNMISEGWKEPPKCLRLLPTPQKLVWDWGSWIVGGHSGHSHLPRAGSLALGQ